MGHPLPKEKIYSMRKIVKIKTNLKDILASQVEKLLILSLGRLLDKEEANLLKTCAELLRIDFEDADFVLSSEVPTDVDKKKLLKLAAKTLKRPSN